MFHFPQIKLPRVQGPPQYLTTSVGTLPSFDLLAVKYNLSKFKVPKWLTL